MPSADTRLAPPLPLRLPLRTIAREWGRIGCIGFGGPPAHVSLLRELCVSRRGWLSDEQFERALAAVNMLPGPASTQLAIYCAWRMRGNSGALVGGLCFIVPGLAAILALSMLFLSGSPPAWVRGAGMGAGAAVPAVAIAAGWGVARPILARARAGGSRRLARALAYGLIGAVSAATVGPYLVAVLLACGAFELGRLTHARRASLGVHASPLLATALLTADPGGTGALAWTAFKVGALAFGGGFVIVPLMQADAVSTYHWLTHAQFLNAVALGQVTPGPVTHTVAAVGYGAQGIWGGLLAALVAFAPSFSFVLIGAARFERLLVNRRVLAFLAGAAPAAAGAIVGAAVPLTESLSQAWQYATLAGAALFLWRANVVTTLVAAGAVGVAVSLLGGPVG
ncbi:MAG TPA: chromate efflux transporter [Solirubrobacteraceae bacterium]|nr:chromate efflux transporter [Solirubrobacteraceae bacterium]